MASGKWFVVGFIAIFATLPNVASAALPRATIGLPNTPSVFVGGGTIVDPGPVQPTDPYVPRPAVPRVSVWPQEGSSTSLDVSFTCGEGLNSIYRREASQSYGPGLYLEPRCPDGKPSGRLQPTGLKPGTEYCYQIAAVGNGPTRRSEACATTRHRRVAFANALMSPTESEQILGVFDWHRTDPVADQTPSYHAQPGQPYLYYMNVLVDDATTAEELRQLGVHMAPAPLFVEELSDWQQGFALASVDGDWRGRWYFAVIPGAIYNAIRAVSIESIDAGIEPPIQAVVFRNIPVPQARGSTWDNHQLSYRYLGEQGFEFNGEVNTAQDCQLVNDQEICHAKILGWLARKILEYADAALTEVVDRVREGIGRFTRLVKGEVSLTLNFRLYDTDPLFAMSGMPMRSGWSGEELRLKGVEVHVRQGLAAFIEKTDSAGRVTLDVARNADTEICVQAENKYVKLTEFLGRTVVCLRNIGKLSTDQSMTVLVRHEYFNVLAQMTDAAEYLRVVAAHDMEKITVLVGDLAGNVAVAGRAFTPCMGRRPNLVTGTLSDALVAFLPIVGTQSLLLELMLSVDIVLPPDDGLSRGVGVHEYGHAVMCDMLTAQGAQGEISFQSIWTQVILASADQSGDNEASYIAEAFADFITSQVIGGTNYFSPPESFDSESVNYCQAGSTRCVDENSDEGSGSGKTRFLAQVRRIEGILHDAFDGHPATGRPNDGSHWDAGTLSNAPLITVGHDSDIQDECITLSGAGLQELFANWVSRGPYITEATFLGALVDTLQDHGNGDDAICHLLALHSASSTCLGLAASQPWRPIARVCPSPGLARPVAAVRPSIAPARVIAN